MQKLLSIAILTVFSFLLCGYLVSYELMIHANRNEIWESIEKNQVKTGIQTIHITADEAKSLVDGREISWKGNRFDIIDLVESNNDVTLHVINDTMEENLIAGFNEMENIGQNSPKQSNRAFSLLNDFFKEYTSNCSLKLQPSHRIIFSITSPKMANATSDGFQNHPAQPPKNIS
jgi:hypothetical protein